MFPPTLQSMYKSLLLLLVLPLADAFAADPALTIYNQNFAVVRDTVPLDLKAGANDVRFTDTTTHLEPDSVILRDPAGKVRLRILEQNYRADPVSQSLLLSLFEGKTIDFLVTHPEAKEEIVHGKIIRSGYVPHSVGLQRYNQQYYQQQMAYANNGTGMGEPIIEVDGKLRFSLPGQPLFPALADDAILKPTLAWKIDSTDAAKLDAELAYITGGMSWEADYSVVAPEKGDRIDLTGLVTIDNQSGKTFADARIKLMAGDVNKIDPNGNAMAVTAGASRFAYDKVSDDLAVTENPSHASHLYTLPRPTTLHDRETKQVEFVRTEGVTSTRFYVYDGVKIDANRYRGYNMESIRNQSEYGTQSNPKVWTMREFKNSEANRLGMPLPKGRVRFYRRDSDGQLEFTGENVIDHTPKDETVRVFTGSAFDLTGERKRTAYKVDNSRNQWADEWFEIRLRNHKKETVEIRVVEHLYRWTNWDISEHSDPFVKTDSQAIEFRVQIKPDEEKVLNYKVHYSW